MQLCFLPEGSVLLLTVNAMVCVRLVTIPNETLPLVLLLQRMLFPVTPVALLTTGTNKLALKPAPVRRKMEMICLSFTFALTPPRGSGLQALLGPRPNLENMTP